jgi:hypothetical protein
MNFILDKQWKVIRLWDLRFSRGENVDIDLLGCNALGRLDRYRRFGGTYCSHLWHLSVSPDCVTTQKTNIDSHQDLFFLSKTENAFNIRHRFVSVRGDTEITLFCLYEVVSRIQGRKRINSKWTKIRKEAYFSNAWTWNRRGDTVVDKRVCIDDIWGCLGLYSVLLTTQSEKTWMCKESSRLVPWILNEAKKACGAATEYHTARWIISVEQTWRRGHELKTGGNLLIHYRQKKNSHRIIGPTLENNLPCRRDFLEANSCLVGQEIPQSLRKQKAYFRVHKSP